MNRYSTVSLALLMLACVPLIRAPSASAAGGKVVVIVGKSLGVSDISKGDLRRAFLGMSTKVGGKRLIPINLSNKSPLRKAFDKAILGLDPSAVGAFWVDRRIRGESSPPRAVPAAALAAKVVASLPGAISYVSASKVNSKVVAVSIDGVGPDSPDWPIK